MKNLFLVLILIVSAITGRAQSLAPTVIATSGDYFESPSLSVSWTIGELMSETYTSTDHFLTQGFHQPSPRIPFVNEECREFFTGFSPNNDGINDWWKIPLCNCYPSNSVTIVNRWGNEVWKIDDYDNETRVFTGQNMNGNELPDGTYYYILHYNNSVKKGWVFIKR
ncbi:MAG: gliding motility-associated C-terminal domain-containing protein [Bacteroidetes bacterium]|nr:gliding motility-associated C-terminal domain-containing protein [Bacteroidota bacterium]